MKIVVYILLVLTIIACQLEKKYDVLPDESTYQLIAFDGTGISPNTGNYLASYLTIADTLGDTLHYVPSYLYFIEFYKGSPLFEVLSTIKTGDSAHYRIKEHQLYEAFGFDRLQANSNRVLELRIRLVDLVKEEAVQDSLMAELSSRLDNEQSDIIEYIMKQADPQSYIETFGIYKKSVIKAWEGEPIKAGDRVTISYTGSFLDGYIFDRKTGEESLEITYGMSDQIVSGLSIAIKGMRQGESVKIILPSQHAFGGRGSVKGIVPPYTPIVYNLSITNVTRKKQQ